jgi:hypothetical protein
MKQHTVLLFVFKSKLFLTHVLLRADWLSAQGCFFPHLTGSGYSIDTDCRAHVMHLHTHQVVR